MKEEIKIYNSVTKNNLNVILCMLFWGYLMFVFIMDIIEKFKLLNLVFMTGFSVLLFFVVKSFIKKKKDKRVKLIISKTGIGSPITGLKRWEEIRDEKVVSESGPMYKGIVHFLIYRTIEHGEVKISIQGLSESRFKIRKYLKKYREYNTSYFK